MHKRIDFHKINLGSYQICFLCLVHAKCRRLHNSLNSWGFNQGANMMTISELYIENKLEGLFYWNIFLILF